MGNKKDWANGIIQNDLAFTIATIDGFKDSEGNFDNKLVFEFSGRGLSFNVKPPEGSHLAYGRVSIPARKKTGTPDAILKHVDTIFGALKKSLKDHSDEFSTSHQYAKKYI